MSPLAPGDARAAAVAALVRVHRGGWANLAAKGALALPGASGRDKAFAGALFYGTAERVATLDFLLAPFLKRPVERLDPEVRAILETGLYQMLFMRVPARAAVNEGVGLARRFGKSSAAGMVNAVLRKAAEACKVEALPPQAGAAERTQAVLAGFSFESEARRVCATYSVGPAVAAAVMQALPEEYDAFLAASFSNGESCVRANALKTDRAALEAAFHQAGAETRPGTLPNALYLRRLGDVSGDALFQEGLYHMQGEASQAACAVLGAEPGHRVLDVCAAPGGKSATLAQSLAGRGSLTACDVHPHRVRLIEEALARLGTGGAEVRVRQQDATEYDKLLEGQDRVLCDVPCSGLGVLAAKPDLRLTDGAGFAGLPALQLAILRTSARYVRPGGRLVYATCTVRPQENEEVVRAFLAESDDFRPAPSLGLPAQWQAGAREGMVTFLPQHTGIEGFFVALLEKV